MRILLINANNFELNQGVIQIIQNNYIFTDKTNEDPKNHLKDFEEIMNTLYYNKHRMMLSTYGHSLFC